MRIFNKTLFLATLMVLASASYALAENDNLPVLSPPSLPPLPSDASSSGNNNTGNNAGISESSLPPLPGTATSNNVSAAPAATANTKSAGMELPLPAEPVLPLPGEKPSAPSAQAQTLPEPQPLKMSADESTKEESKPVAPSEDAGKAADEQTNADTTTTAAPKVNKSKKHSTKGKHKKKKKSKKAKSKTSRYSTYYAIKDRLPSAIYKKEYAPENFHLPIMYTEKDYDNLLFIAAMNNDVNGIRSMMHVGRTSNMVDDAGDTPLLLAVKNDAVDSARLLLVRNADPAAKDRNGMTAMQIAQKMGDPAMIEALNDPLKD